MRSGSTRSLKSSAAILGGVSFVVPCGFLRYNLTFLEEPVRVVASVAVFLVVVCGPSVIGLATTRVRAVGETSAAAE